MASITMSMSAACVAAPVKVRSAPGGDFTGTDIITRSGWMQRKKKKRRKKTYVFRALVFFFWRRRRRRIIARSRETHGC